MRDYLIKRALAMIPTVLGITIITFLIIQLAPGSPAEMKIRRAEGGGLSPQYTAAIIEETKKLYGLDKPIPVQYLLWLKRVVTFNFGNSYKDQRPVREKILERVPISLQLELISIFLVYLFAVPIGAYSAVKQDSLGDRLVTVFLFVLYSLPSFWTAMMLITFLGGGGFFDWFPVFGLSSDGARERGFGFWLPDRIHHLVLPVVCLSYGGLAYISRQMRGGMLEEIRKDYIRTARAKGVSEKMVVAKHAFRNSLIPIVTMLASLLPAMIGGSVIIESIFSIPGMGKLSFEAILSRDYPTIMGITTVAALLTLAGILLSDLAYTLVDPRISFASEPFTIKPKTVAAILAAVVGLAALAILYNRIDALKELSAQLRPHLFYYGVRGAIGLIVVSLLYVLFLMIRDLSYWRQAARQYWKNKLSVAALLGTLGLGLVALAAPLLANDKPLVMSRAGNLSFPAFQDYLPESWRPTPIPDWPAFLAGLSKNDWALMPPVPISPLQTDLAGRYAAPGATYWLGADDVGRDQLARIIHGTRIALSVGFVAVGIYVFIGVVLGALAGYYGGWVDMVISRLIEVVQCIPTFFLILAVIAFLEPSIYNVMAAIGFVGWTGVARLTRGELLKQRGMDYVAASRALGASDLRVIFRHALPNALTPALVVATFGVADAILIESSLSFLGFGVQPPTPSWGDMLSKARVAYEFAWWTAVFPGLPIFLTVTMLNLVGEGIRDAIDPRLRGAK